MPYLKAHRLPAIFKKLDKELDQANRKLIYLGGEILFQSERDLEDYIEENFSELFPDLVLVKRQLNIKRQQCDLLCCTKSVKQPVIIELKNEEDRGIVSQLTRYRKALLEEKPFLDQIDYSLPFRLVAIAPTFHEDNYTDKEASKFEEDLCFWEFSVENHNDLGKFKLCGKTYDILYPIFCLPGIPVSSDSISSGLPFLTLNFLAKLDKEYHEEFRELRTLFLSQPKVKEMVSPSYSKLLYGTGEGKNHKKLAEITNTGKGLCLFLWLPTAAKANIKIPIDRFGFVLAKDSNPLSKDSLVEWIVCTQGTIDLKIQPKFEANPSFNKNGMLKWCKPNSYLAQATIGSLKTLLLLINLIKGVTPPIDDATLNWWETYKIKTPDYLGWYIDLAIKTWNYRFK
jgi:hypothetical protein